MRVAAAAAIAAVLAGCAPYAPAPSASDRACALRREFHAAPLPGVPPGDIAALRRAGLSDDATRTAEAIGAVGPIRIILGAERAPERQTWFLIGRQALSERVLLSLLEVEASVAALECDGTRAQALASRLDSIQSNRNSLINAAGIAIGAVSGIASGVLGLANAGTASDWVTITGGVGSGITSTAAMLQTSTGHFLASSQMLEDVLRQPVHSTAFPPRVWRFLTQRPQPGAPTPAEEVVAEWRGSGLIPADGDEQATLAILRAEGRLSSGDLDTRRMILDVLVARIALLHRNIRRLLDEVTGRPMPPALAAGPAWLRAEAARGR